MESVRRRKGCPVCCVTPEGAGVVTPKKQEYVFGTNLELKAEQTKDTTLLVGK